MTEDVRTPPPVNEGIASLPVREPAGMTQPIEARAPPHDNRWAVTPAISPPPVLDAQLEAERDYKGLFERKLEEIIQTAQTAPQTKEGRSALGKLVTLSKRLSDTESPALYRQAYLATLAFAANGEKNDVAVAIVQDLEFVSSRSSPIYIVMRGLCATVVLLVGLVTTVSVAIMLWNFDLLWWLFTYVGAAPAAMAGLFGVLGSVVSILLRLSDFAETKRKSRDFLLMTGACLPIVGLVFALVTAALFEARLINFATSGAQETADYGIAFYVVIGFLSGFSERFTRGLLVTAENGLTPAREATEGAAYGGSRSKVGPAAA